MAEDQKQYSWVGQNPTTDLMNLVHKCKEVQTTIEYDCGTIKCTVKATKILNTDKCFTYEEIYRSKEFDINNFQERHNAMIAALLRKVLEQEHKIPAECPATPA